VLIEIFLIIDIIIISFLRKIKSKKEKKLKEDETPSVDSINTIKSNEKLESEEKDLENSKKEKTAIKFEEVKKSTKRVGVKTIVVEHEKLKDEIIKTPLMPKKKEALTIPVKIREFVEKTSLMILYKEKSVKSLKVLIDKVLERAFEEKITVSEKMISLLINQMDMDDKIQFTQKEGWKIKI
jgi:hypothetical protein